MCWFITIGASARVLSAVGTCVHGITLTPASGSPTSALFPPDLACVWVTRHGCSCGLMGFPASRLKFDEVKERARLARRGWSAAKIERAIASKEERVSRPVEPESGEGAAAFRGLVADLVRAGGSVHLLAHFYAGSIATEAVAVEAVAERTLAEFEQSMLGASTLTTVRANEV
jgi:hypothetical protein